MPTLFTPAYPHWDKPWPGPPESMRKTIDVNGKPVLEELGLFWASVATLAGQPATAFPGGLTRGGLPIGLQAIGPYLEDRTPIRFATIVGQEFGGVTPPRRYDGGRRGGAEGGSVSDEPRRLPHCAYPTASDVAQHGVQPLPAVLPLVDFERARVHRSRRYTAMVADRLTPAQVLAM